MTEAPHWTLRLLDTGPCWVAALAVAGTEFELEEFHWPPLPVSLAAQTD